MFFLNIYCMLFLMAFVRQSMKGLLTYLLTVFFDSRVEHLVVGNLMVARFYASLALGIIVLSHATPWSCAQYLPVSKFENSNSCSRVLTASCAQYYVNYEWECK